MRSPFAFCSNEIPVMSKAGSCTTRPTEIIRRILPFLDRPDAIHLPAQCLTAETAALLQGEADRLQQRIDCLTRNRDAIQASFRDGFLLITLPKLSAPIRPITTSIPVQGA